MPDELRITSKLIYEELVLRGIEPSILDTISGLLRFTHKGEIRYIQGSLTDRSSPIGRNIANKKSIASRVSESLGLRQPAAVVTSDYSEAHSFLVTQGKVVVKPEDGSHGKGINIDVEDENTLRYAIENAQSVSKLKKVIIQQQIAGDDIRVLMIGGQLAAAAIRQPAKVVGDGVSTLEQLINTENSNPLRGTNYHKQLNVIDVAAAKYYLGSRFESFVPQEDEHVQVVGTANIGTGGTATDISERLPVEIVAQSQVLMRELAQDCCGVDFMTSDIDNPSEYYFIEVNSSPSFGLHVKPSFGDSRQVHKLFVDTLLAAR